ncbi:hypothetical protein OBBRIDRAFT_316547 [Obba rivulosa]|uniref:Uncharacterized protein n=1 Tax=Obba rivulosa TaxID=1052685 RepID=A0A8E2J2L6_9APHY|nr:hypothetical protein OBBRIDRAFT_316547 [Obba rivulosa]
MLPLPLALFALAAYLGLLGGNVMPLDHLILAHYPRIQSVHATLDILADVLSAELRTVQADVDNLLTQIDIRAYLTPTLPPSVEDFFANTVDFGFHNTLDSSALYWTNARIALADFIHPGEFSCKCPMDGPADATPNFDIPAILQEPGIFQDLPATVHDLGEPEQFVMPFTAPLHVHLLRLPEPLPGTQSPREIGDLLAPPSSTTCTYSHFHHTSDSTHRSRPVVSLARSLGLYGLGAAWHTFCFGQLSDFLERYHLGLSTDVPPFVLCIFLGFIAGKIVKYLSRKNIQGGRARMETVEIYHEALLNSPVILELDITLPTVAPVILEVTDTAPPTIAIRKRAASVPATRTLTFLKQHRRAASEFAEALSPFNFNEFDGLSRSSPLRTPAQSSQPLSSPTTSPSRDHISVWNDYIEEMFDELSRESPPKAPAQASQPSFSPTTSPSPDSVSIWSEYIEGTLPSLNFDEFDALPQESPPRTSAQSSQPPSSPTTSLSPDSISVGSHLDDIDEVPLHFNFDKFDTLPRESPPRTPSQSSELPSSPIASLSPDSISTGSHLDDIDGVPLHFNFDEFDALPQSSPPRTPAQASLPSSSPPTSSCTPPFPSDVSFESYSDEIEKISVSRLNAVIVPSSPSRTHMQPSSPRLQSLQPAATPSRCMGHNIPGLPPTPINHVPLLRPSARSIAEPMRQPLGRGPDNPTGTGNSRRPRPLARAGPSRLVMSALQNIATDNPRSVTAPTRL